jgi:hypothetical protein
MVATAEQEARAEGERIRGNAHAEGDAVIARAKDEGRALLEQVQEARKRVLGDLATRRRALSIQIEQLRAARDEMAASISGVRDAVDGILVNLSRSDEDARSAALAAGDQARLHGAADGPEGPMGPISSEGPEEPVGPVAAVPAPAPAVKIVENVTSVVSSVSPVSPVSPEGTAGDDPAHEGPAPSVDELFARIRAGTDETGAPTGVGPSASAPTQAVAVTPAEGVASVPSADGAAAPETAAVVAAGPDQPLIDRRNELLTPVTSQLARHIKRALGDDQNRLLELLRNSPAASGAALLGPEDVHLATFVSAAQGHMADAFAAGVEFTGGTAGSAPSAARDAAVEQSSAGLARTVVTMLRRRIEDGTDAGEEVADRVGAAFREWRGERIERLVGDFAVQAFSAGVAAATPAGALVRWVLTTPGGCSDCDDNALAGAVAASEGFPTGHPYPPAHSGCRCLVVLAPA